MTQSGAPNPEKVTDNGPAAATGSLPRAGLPKRIHAWMLAHLCGGYERMVADRKSALFAGLHGDVLEIGPGAGPNLRYFPSGIHYIGVEPNPYLYPYLEKAAQEARVSIEIRSGMAERLPADDSSVDGVVSTLVLCSVQDPAATIREALRVLKPGGRFVFIEHVAAEHGTRLRKVQDFLCPVWKKLADGCHLNRETQAEIEQAGFSRVHCEPFQLPLGPIAEQIAGFAIK